MATSEHIRRFFRFIANPWSWPMDFAVAFILVHLFPGALTTEAKREAAFATLWSDILVLPQNPIFQLGFLLTAFFCLRNGLHRIESAQARETERRNLDRERQLAPLKKLIVNFGGQASAEARRDQLAVIDERISEYEGRIGDLKGAERSRLIGSATPTYYTAISHIFSMINQQREYDGEPTITHSDTMMQLDPDPDDEMGRSKLFYPAKNSTYLAEQERNIADAKRQVGQIRTRLDHTLSELKRERPSLMSRF